MEEDLKANDFGMRMPMTLMMKMRMMTLIVILKMVFRCFVLSYLLRFSTFEYIFLGLGFGFEFLRFWVLIYDSRSIEIFNYLQIIHLVVKIKQPHIFSRNCLGYLFSLFSQNSLSKRKMTKRCFING